MFGREELKAYRPYANRDGFYHKSEVDNVMDEMEQRIDDECGNNQILSNVNESLRRRLYESNGKILKLEKELREANKRIKKLEAENAELKKELSNG